MNTRSKTIKDEYKQLCAYLSKLDRNINMINKEARQEVKQSTKLFLDMYNILAKKELMDEDLNVIAKGVNSSFFELGNCNQTIFDLVCFHIMREQEKKGLVREKFFQILQTIVSKEDFSVFDVEENILAFENLYVLFGRNNIEILAILNYLTSQDKLRSMVTGSVSRNGLARTVVRLNEFCYFLEKNDIKIYVHS